MRGTARALERTQRRGAASRAVSGIFLTMRALDLRLFLCFAPLLACRPDSTPASQPPATPPTSGPAETTQPVAESGPKLFDTGKDGEFWAVPFPMPTEVARCEQEWVLAEAPTEATTRACLETYLIFAYGSVPDEEALSLDPIYGDPIELRYSAAQLRDMAARTRKVCAAPEKGFVSECERAVEYFEGMAARKGSLFEDVNVEGIEAPLLKVLNGETLVEFDVWLQHEQLAFSALNLGKLAAAVYARHGYRFEDEDLRAFFYEARPEGWDKLDLPLLEPDDGFTPGDLEEVDRANLAMIERARNRELRRHVEHTWCFPDEVVVFACTVGEPAVRVSLCGGGPEDALEWLVVRRGMELPTDRSPFVHEAVEDVAVYRQYDDVVHVEMTSDLGQYEVVRKGTGEASSYELSIPMEKGSAKHPCTAPVADRLEAVGAAVPKSQWKGAR